MIEQESCFHSFMIMNLPIDSKLWDVMVVQPTQQTFWNYQKYLSGYRSPVTMAGVHASFERTHFETCIRVFGWNDQWSYFLQRSNWQSNQRGPQTVAHCQLLTFKWLCYKQSEIIISELSTDQS